MSVLLNSPPFLTTLLYDCYYVMTKQEAEAAVAQASEAAVELWGLLWARERSKEGKPLLVTVLPNEGAYEGFMQRFDAEDSEEVRPPTHPRASCFYSYSHSPATHGCLVPPPLSSYQPPTHQPPMVVSSPLPSPLPF